MPSTNANSSPVLMHYGFAQIVRLSEIDINRTKKLAKTTAQQHKPAPELRRHNLDSLIEGAKCQFTTAHVPYLF